jgi:putative phosphoribosyl transferase
VQSLAPLVDATVCLYMPEPFRAIGLHYDDFHQLDDSEVLALLEPFSRRAAGGPVSRRRSPE